MVIKIFHLFLFMFLMWLLENFKLQMGLSYVIGQYGCRALKLWASVKYKLDATRHSFLMLAWTNIPLDYKLKYIPSDLIAWCLGSYIIFFIHYTLQSTFTYIMWTPTSLWWDRVSVITPFYRAGHQGQLIQLLVRGREGFSQFFSSNLSSFLGQRLPQYTLVPVTLACTSLGGLPMQQYCSTKKSRWISRTSSIDTQP